MRRRFLMQLAIVGATLVAAITTAASHASADEPEFAFFWPDRGRWWPEDLPVRMCYDPTDAPVDTDGHPRVTDHEASVAITGALSQWRSDDSHFAFRYAGICRGALSDRWDRVNVIGWSDLPRGARGRFDARTEGEDGVVRVVEARVHLAIGSDAVDVVALSHELGHVLGLAHSRAGCTLMSANACSQEIAPGDIAGMEALYPGAALPPSPVLTSDSVLPNEPSVPRPWSNAAFPIPYCTSHDRAPLLGDGSPFLDEAAFVGIVTSAFDAWALPGSGVSFSYQGPCLGNAELGDGVNSVVWQLPAISAPPNELMDAEPDGATDEYDVHIEWPAEIALEQADEWASVGRLRSTLAREVGALLGVEVSTSTDSARGYFEHVHHGPGLDDVRRILAAYPGERPLGELVPAPARGEAALAVWGGGTVGEVRVAAALGGCVLEAIAPYGAGTGSGLVVFVAGAPPVANRAFLSSYASGELPPGALFVRCAP